MPGPIAVMRVAEVARRSGAWKWGAVALVAVILLPVLAAAVFVAAAWDAVANLTSKPTQVTAMAAYMAASKCGFAPDVKLSTAYLVAVAHEATSDGALGFGHYKNPLGPTADAAVPGDILQHVDLGSLRAGGFTNSMLGLSGDYLPRDWTTALPDTRGEWGVGFLLIRPSDWRQWVAEVPGGSVATLDPYKPYDAMVVLACHLRAVEGQGVGALDATLTALRNFGGSSVLQFVDQVMDVARRDAATPLLIPADLARAMAAFAADRGGAYLQRVQGQFLVSSVGVGAIPPGGGTGQFAWPLRGPITQGFGCTDLLGEPFDPNCPSLHTHTGLDIAPPFGTPVAAADIGVVTVANLGWGGGYGNHVMINHGNGYVTLYGHLSAVLVTVGEPVQRGQVIGLEGSTGFSTGPHLHFEIRKDGVFQNPLAYLN